MAKTKPKVQLLTLKKIIISLVFIFYMLCIEDALAATNGVGVKITLKDVLGTVIEQANVLKKTDSSFSGSYKVWSGLPSFNNENATEVLSTWTDNETNVVNLMKAAGFSTTVSQAKLNNYILIVEGLYKTTKTQYRKTVMKDGVACAEWGTKTETYMECKRCRAAGCERFGTRYCAAYNESCTACGGKKRTKTVTYCKSQYTAWQDTKPTLNSGETLESRVVSTYTNRQATVVDFERTKIEQAKKCGLTSSYKDNLTLADVVGSKDYKDSELTKTYWSVYCIEENKFTFPGFKPSVDSGGHFTWTVGKTDKQNILDGLTSTLYGKRSCRAVSDYSKWKDKYDSWTSKIGSYVFTRPKEAYCGDSRHPNMVSANGYGKMCASSGTIGSSSCYQYVNGKCVAPNKTGSGGSAVSLVSVSYRCPKGTTESSGKCWKNDVSDLKGYLNSMNDMLKIPDEMTNFGTAKDYVLKTQMAIDYEEPVYGIHAGESQSQLISKRVDEKTTTKNKVTTSKTVTYYTCSLSGVEKSCTRTSKTFTWVSRIDKIFEVNYEYTLENNFYRYVLLPSGKSVHVVPTSYGSSASGFQNYINIGYPNYPVHYTTAYGTYDLNIYYNYIGYKNHFEEYIRGDSSVTIDSNGNIFYDCEYDTKNGQPFCPEGGCDGDPNTDPSCPGGNCNPDEQDKNSVKLIYRPISLVTPFPGTSGSGRTAGNNWNSNTLINKFILSNRNTAGNAIYNKEPMYQITLTPSIIKSIRTYNKKTTYDDFNLKCVKGYECKSEFIRESSVGFASYFSGCGIGNWNACDKQDGFTR